MKEVIAIGLRRSGSWAVARAEFIRRVTAGERDDGSCPRCPRGKLYRIGVPLPGEPYAQRRMCDSCLHTEVA